MTNSRGSLDGASFERCRAGLPVGRSVSGTISARGRLVRAEARPKGTLITTEADVSVVGADKPSLLYMMQVLYLP